MTSWLRPVRGAGALIVAVFIAYGGESSYAAEPSPSASASPQVSPSAATPSRAGSRPGEGRERPGRRDEAAEAEPVDTEAAVPEGDTEDEGEPDADEGIEEGAEEGEGTDSGLDSEADGDATAVPQPPRGTAAVPPAHPRPPAKAATRAERPAEPRLRILSLGGGLILVGLGLGLAFVALRVRRAAS